MQWVINSNFYKEAGYIKLVETLDRLGLPKQIVKTVPMTDRLLPEDLDTSKAKVDVDQLPEPEIDATQPIIIMGSYTLAKIAKKRGWTPGAFTNNLDYNAIKAGWGGENLLNGDFVATTVKELETVGDMFIRPVADSKDFSGKVFSQEEFVAWKATLLKMGKSDLFDADTPVIAAKPKDIYVEVRNFCIDNRIITSSVYKQGGRVIYLPQVDEDILEFGSALIKQWRPDEAFVLDIARTDQGLKVVETNCLNAAGFYASDVAKLVMALEERFR